MEIFEQIESWHWLVFGMFALGLEMFGIGGFLIGIGLAALIQGLIGLVATDLDWTNQFIIFGINSVILSVLYWKYFRKFNEKTDQPELHNRSAKLIGRTFELKDDFEHGQDRLQIGDTMWKATCKSDLKKGTTVEVIGADSMMIEIAEKK